MRAVLVGIGLGVAVVAFGCDDDGGSDAGTDASAPVDAGGPEDAGTDAGSDEPDAGPPCSGPPGLYVEGSCTELAEGIEPYHPRYELWADGASKDRHIYLPTGTIQTFDADNWVFPVGTRIYKTFLLDGVRLETRVLEKTSAGTGPSSWDMRVWAWNEDQDEVTDVTNTADAIRENVLGTEHDIPSGAQCVECHRASLDTVNGFSAIQLNHAEDGVTLASLIADGRLTDPPTLAQAEIPGTGTVQDALGYMHANCGHCHRYTAYDTPPPGPECTDADDRCGNCNHAACITGLRAWVRVQDVQPEDTDLYVTAVGRRSNWVDSVPICRIHPGNPDMSAMYVRASRRGEMAQMPPIATEQAHADGLTTLRAFITLLTGDCTLD